MQVAAGGLVLIAFLSVIGLLATAFWLWMLIDAAMNEPSGSEKIVWVLIIVFVHFIGALVYYFVRRPKRMAEPGGATPYGGC